MDFKFVIVGTGNISNTYCQAIEKIDNVEVVGIVSRNGQKPDALANANDVKIAPAISDIKSDYVGVILCTPNGLHHKAAIEAARLGKHVLTEKVLDISVESMDAMIQVCKENKVKLGVAYQRRMSPDNKVIKEMIESGKLGKIFGIDLTLKNYRDQAYYDSSEYRGTWSIDGGGCFIQQGAHYIDLYTWFFGMPEYVISALGTFTHDIEVEDHGAVILKHKDGKIGTIVASTATKPGFDAKFEIHSDKGTLILENDRITNWLIDDIPDPANTQDVKIHSGAQSASVADTSGHEAIISDFVQAVRENREPAVSGVSARKATELILKFYNNTIEKKCF